MKLFYTAILFTIVPLFAIAMNEEYPKPFLLQCISNNMRANRAFITINYSNTISRDPDTVHPRQIRELDIPCTKLTVCTSAGQAEIEESLIADLIYPGSTHYQRVYAKLARFKFYDQEKEPLYTDLFKSKDASTLPIDVEIDENGIVQVFKEQREKNKE